MSVVCRTTSNECKKKFPKHTFAGFSTHGIWHALSCQWLINLGLNNQAESVTSVSEQAVKIKPTGVCWDLLMLSTPFTLQYTSTTPFISLVLGPSPSPVFCFLFFVCFLFINYRSVLVVPKCTICDTEVCESIAIVHGDWMAARDWMGVYTS